MALSQLFPGVTGTGLTAHIRPSGAGRAPLAYAAVTDNASSDPTYYAALAPAPILYVPGIASITGFGDAFFRSEIAIANSGQGPAAVTVTFLEHDRDNSSAPTARFVLGPHETLHADDALFALFGLAETYGALRIQSDSSPGVTVFERILTDATRTAGTVGQQIEALAEEQLVSRGSLLGIRQDDAFRTNVAWSTLTPPRRRPPSADRSPPATELGTTTVCVPPQGYVQRNLAALFPGWTTSRGCGAVDPRGRRRPVPARVCLGDRQCLPGPDVLPGAALACRNGPRGAGRLDAPANISSWHQPTRGRRVESPS